jgi:hypothetical protein
MDDSKTLDQADAPGPSFSQLTRRGFVAMSLLMATGCATSQRLSMNMPDPVWGPIPGMAPPTPVAVPTVAQPLLATPSAGLVARAGWAKGSPVATLMNRMLPARRITVHHDGMAPFYATATSSIANRMESIRRAHRHRGWGDIGYHYALDPAGRVWMARPLLWQGAHVKDQNHGNIGIVVLGNYSEQGLNAAQVSGLDTFIKVLMRQYSIPSNEIWTHQEFPTAHTECPGRSLQAHMDAARSSSLA